MRWFRGHAEAPRLLRLSPLRADEDVNEVPHHVCTASRARGKKSIKDNDENDYIHPILLRVRERGYIYTQSDLTNNAPVTRLIFHLRIFPLPEILNYYQFTVNDTISRIYIIH